MKKYRVIKKGSWYYPQQRVYLFFWKSFRDSNGVPFASNLATAITYFYNDDGVVWEGDEPTLNDN